MCPSVSGDDYVVPDPFTVTFSSGPLSSSSANVIIIDDAILEETTETFSVSVTGSDVTGFSLGVNTTVSITDNEGTFMLMMCVLSLCGLYIVGLHSAEQWFAR